MGGVRATEKVAETTSASVPSVEACDTTHSVSVSTSLPLLDASILPRWVARVERKDHGDGGVELLVCTDNVAAPGIAFDDIELDVSAEVIRLQLRGEEPLELPVPAGTNSDALAASWSRKTYKLKLRFP